MYRISLTGEYPALVGKVTDALYEANAGAVANDLQVCEAARLLCGEGSHGWEEGLTIYEAVRVLTQYGCNVTAGGAS